MRNNSFWSREFSFFAAGDCALAAENMMLEVDKLGVGSCYTG